MHDHEVPLQLPHLPHHRKHLPTGKIYKGIQKGLFLHNIRLDVQLTSAAPAVRGDHHGEPALRRQPLEPQLLRYTQQTASSNLE